MIQEAKIHSALFWSEEFICLNCGETGDSVEALDDCCGEPKIFRAEDVQTVLDNVQRSEE